MAEFKIELGVQLNEGDLGKIKTRLSDIDAKPIKIKVDASGVKNDTNWIYKQLMDIQKKANSLTTKMRPLDIKVNSNELAELSRQIINLKGDYAVLKRTFGEGLTDVQMGNLQAEIDETSNKLKVLDAKYKDTKAKLADGIKLKLDNGAFKNDISKIETDFRKLSSVSKEVRPAIDMVNRALDDMKTASARNDIDGLISANERYEKALKSVNNQLKINTRTEKEKAAAAKLADDTKSFQSGIDAWLKKNSAAAKKFGVELTELKAKAESCDRTTLNHLQNEFKRIDKAADAAGLKTQTLGDRLKHQFSKYSVYFSAASAIMYTTMALRDMFNQVVAVDSAMTELKKVTDESSATYNKFLTNAAGKAKEIGTTISDYISSTADFARLGYDFADSQKLAGVANIYAVVGDEIDGVEDATKSVISTMKAFGIEASNSMSIVDKMNEVSNNFAISSGGIGEALQRSASSMKAAGNDLDETIALITASNTVVQDPTVVGTALKTVSMRIRGAKTEMEEAGIETDGMAESTAKLQKELKALSGVDIMLDKDTFKSTYQIMEEIAAKWEDLTDIQQASVTELIAGKRQGNIVSSLMTNFDVAQEALETSRNSAGSAATEHQKWLESLEAFGFCLNVQKCA